MLFEKTKNIEVRHSYEAVPVPIIRHAAATLPEAMGQLAPILIVDTSNRPDIEEYVRIHEHSPPGDVNVQWGRRLDNRSTYRLILSVIRPVELVIIFDLPFPDAISVIDHITYVGKLCIQPGRPGDTLSGTFFGSKRVIMEIPDTGFRARWEKRVRRHFERKFAKSGLPRKLAIKSAH